MMRCLIFATAIAAWVMGAGTASATCPYCQGGDHTSQDCESVHDSAESSIETAEGAQSSCNTQRTIAMNGEESADDHIVDAVLHDSALEGPTTIEWQVVYGNDAAGDIMLDDGNDHRDSANQDLEEAKDMFADGERWLNGWWEPPNYHAPNYNVAYHAFVDASPKASTAHEEFDEAYNAFNSAEQSYYAVTHQIGPDDVEENGDWHEVYNW